MSPPPCGFPPLRTDGYIPVWNAGAGAVDLVTRPGLADHDSFGGYVPGGRQKDEAFEQLASVDTELRLARGIGDRRDATVFTYWTRIHAQLLPSIIMSSNMDLSIYKGYTQDAKMLLATMDFGCF